MKSLIKFTSLLVAGIVLAACAGTPHNPHDPYEGYNRNVYAFNTAFDKAISKPVAEGYKFVVPQTVRTGFGNAFSNLGDTRTAVIDLTQGQFVGALESVHRFVFNSTFGILGLIDLTESFNLPAKHTNDFGTTLAKMGWKNSNYFVIPFLGPSTPRDGWGVVGDLFATPHNYMLNKYASAGLTVAGLVHLRSELLDVDSVTKKAALNPYVFQREAFMQYRTETLRKRGVTMPNHDQYVDYGDDDDEMSISDLARKRNQASNDDEDDYDNLSLSDLARMKNQ